MKQYLGIFVGLVIGFAASVLYKQSQPPAVGSAAERVLILERDLQRSQHLVNEFQTGVRQSGRGRNQQRGSTADGFRIITERLRAGEEVSLDDVFTTMKPTMRTLAPLFDRMRLQGQREAYEQLAGELKQKYNLSETHQKELEAWMEQRATENAEAFQKIINSEETGMVDFLKTTDFDDTWNQDQSDLDGFLEQRLTGEDLANYQAERYNERYDQVVAEAHRKFDRLDEAVDLDEQQLDTAFGLMVRGADGYSNDMEYDGMSDNPSQRAPLDRGASTTEILALLTPAQQNRYAEAQEERRLEAEKDLKEIGLTLPKNWELLDDDSF